jgi:hypothetical protein
LQNRRYGVRAPTHDVKPPTAIAATVDEAAFSWQHQTSSVRSGR